MYLNDFDFSEWQEEELNKCLMKFSFSVELNYSSLKLIPAAYYQGVSWIVQI